MDNKSKTRIVIGGILAVAALFAALSIVSYHSSDPGCINYIKGNDTHNWCGPAGARLSGFLFQAFGSPAVVCILGMTVFWAYVLIATKQTMPDIYLKLVGSLLFVVSISALSASVGMKSFFTSHVGTLLSVFAGSYMGGIGAFLVLTLFTFLSLLLATDFMVVKPATRALASAWFLTRSAVAKMRLMQAAAAKNKAAAPKARPVPEAPSAKSASLAAASAGSAATVAARPVKIDPPAGKAKADDAKAPDAEPKKSLLPALFFGAARSDEKAESAVLQKSVRPAPAAPAPVASPVASPFVAPVISPPTKPAKPGLDAERKGTGGYVFPSLGHLDEVKPGDTPDEEEYIQEKARILEETIAEFKMQVKVIGIETGPTVTQYELELAPGIKVNSIHSLSDDIAMALKAASVRIIAPIPGRDSVGVEVPNTKKAVVRLRGLLEERVSEKEMALPMYLGRNAQGVPLVTDLAEMPHLLIAGATGAGKSVCINSVILSVLMRQHPDDVKLLLVDPKMVELSAYKDVPHLICPVVTDMKKASSILEWACVQMDNRYEYLSAVSVRHITRYNKLGPKGIRERLSLPPDAEIEIPGKMPYVIIIIDELADLMMVAAKDIETFITRLAQKSRAVGIHLVLATQRPSVDVITGLIKSNLPARLSFKVSSRIDSRTILDQNGAEKLLGKGDMLFLPPGLAKLIRAQGTLVSDDEIRRVVDFVKGQSRPAYDEGLISWRKDDGEGEQGRLYGEESDGEAFEGRDPLYNDAVRIVIENQRGSVSLLQRRLEIGYSRAARLIDMMAETGILGPYKGSQAREVLYTPDQWDEVQKELQKRGS